MYFIFMFKLAICLSVLVEHFRSMLEPLKCSNLRIWANVFILRDVHISKVFLNEVWMGLRNCVHISKVFLNEVWMGLRNCVHISEVFLNEVWIGLRNCVHISEVFLNEVWMGLRNCVHISEVFSQ